MALGSNTKPAGMKFKKVPKTGYNWNSHIAYWVLLWVLLLNPIMRLMHN